MGKKHNTKKKQENEGFLKPSKNWLPSLLPQSPDDPWKDKLLDTNTYHCEQLSVRPPSPGGPNATRLGGLWKNNQKEAHAQSVCPRGQRQSIPHGPYRQP